ncbi:hypothetical protein D5S17_17795 [Pseudonocardiaceae bacterium YIM PH 21723]|nr:hypothetical protein D5S17_17795 [Pseudonocardiaceae bacterium YIM PH 21723]
MEGELVLRKALAIALTGALLPVAATAAPTPGLHSADLDVQVGTDFPRVISYTDRRTGAVLHGRDTALDTVLINGKPYKATTARGQQRTDKATYTLTFADLPGVTINASLSVAGRVVTFAVDKIEDTAQNRVGTLEIPNHDLISVRGSDPSAQIAAAKIDLDAAKSGDTIAKVTKDTPADTAPQGSAYTMLSTGKLAAAIETNSVYDINDAKSYRDNSRLWRQARKSGEDTQVGVWSGQWTYRAAGAADTEPLPWAKVVITPDTNKDSTVDWQDAANAFRTIMWQPQGGEHTKDRVIPHIPYNFASQATHPFLRTLDDVKRISLATDGLGQFALLKGFASEGHDSAHPDYAGHYNERAGGLADLNTLLDKGKQWNTDFGVHVNVTESYPEAKAFSEKLVDKNNKQWNWLDQSYRIDQRRDLISGDVQKRFEQLRKDTKGNLNMLYIDVFREFGWTADRLMRELRKQGWQITTEWAHNLEREALWSHWANDIDYGGNNFRGINSSIIRFVRNDQKDVFVHSPLLMGGRIVEFEGWTNEVDYPAFLKNVFEQNLPTKWLQQSPITKMSAAEVNMQNGISVKQENGVRRMYAGQDVVYDGDKYLLPWQDKAYHFNPKGGATTWKLTGALEGARSVQVYELSDQGRGKPVTVQSSGGKVTLDAKAGVPYVLTLKPGESPKANWGEGTKLKDPGFYAGDLSGWTVTGSASVARNERGQQEAVVGSAETMVSQEVTGLTPGEYTVSIQVEVEPGKSRHVEVFAADKVSALDSSPVVNKVAADEKHDTHFQRIPVHFTVPNGQSSAKIGVKVAAGDATVKLDDARLVRAVGPKVDGATRSWDFEDGNQGLGPFVGGGENASTDARTHRSEKHAPYTQRGWNGKAIDDVIDGQWSIKSQEDDAMLVLRTVPGLQTFTPGKKYRITFQYEAAAANHAWITGNGVKEESQPLAATGDPKTVTYEFTAGDDAWVGFRHTNDQAAEFALDNFQVTEL